MFQVKFDMLTSNAIQFLASVADRQQYKSLFEDANTLASICEKIIVPNIEMRDVDVELFEDNPEEYIRRDLVRSALKPITVDFQNLTCPVFGYTSSPIPICRKSGC